MRDSRNAEPDPLLQITQSNATPCISLPLNAYFKCVTLCPVHGPLGLYPVTRHSLTSFVLQSYEYLFIYDRNPVFHARYPVIFILFNLHVSN